MLFCFSSKANLFAIRYYTISHYTHFLEYMNVKSKYSRNIFAINELRFVCSSDFANV